MSDEITKAVADELAKIEAAKQAEAEAKAAMRAEIEKEIKETPNYRATSNVNKIEGDKGLPSEKLETFSYVRSLIEDAKNVFAGGAPAMRASTLALEESQAGEIRTHRRKALGVSDCICNPVPRQPF